MHTNEQILQRNIDITLPHDDFYEDLRAREFGRLDTNKQIYLDYTGGNLYALTQLEKHVALLKNNIFGNPHSMNPASAFSTQLVEEARTKVLQFFNAEDYYCIFTPNATGALKIVGESYPFEENGRLLLLADNHNSVNGIREFCITKDGKFDYATIHYEDLMIDADSLDEKLSKPCDCDHKLFAFPAQSNVSGVRHDLSWVTRAQELGWDVLLDAAAYVPTSKLDLRTIQPDFVSISFYKIFGYPTGIGCLLVKKDKFELLHKRWFAGGTVTMVSILSPHHFLASNHERFEDGTVNYLDIPAISTGLDFIETIGMHRIHARVDGLIQYLTESIATLQHDNGRPLIRIFGPDHHTHAGGTLIMNVLDINGDQYPFESVERNASDHGISIRSGCFCNPGIDETNYCLTGEELARFYSSRDKGNYADMKLYLGKMRGAIRVSVGYATVQRDIDAFIAFLKTYLNVAVDVQ